MSQIVIDAIDRKILKYLITNARMPFLEIARKCGISGAADRKSTRLNSSHIEESRMPSSA